MLFFALASIGLPGLGDFVGEFLTLLGTFRVSIGLTVVATIGILASTFYALKVIQRAFHGPNAHEWSIPDLGARELLIMIPMMLILLWLGLYPQPVLRTFEPAMHKLQEYASPAPVLSTNPSVRPRSYHRSQLPRVNGR
jgi:NADH-quinone oxidoreductase subunit M